MKAWIVNGPMLLHLSSTSLMPSITVAFTNPSIVYSYVGPQHHRTNNPALFSTETNTDTNNNDASFSAFAEILEDDELFNEDDNDKNLYETSTWQESLEDFLNPMTPPGKKQILLSDLVSANGEIRTSIESALRERKLDPILTPTGRKLQDGTRAVARQITNDILPSLVNNNNSNNSNKQPKNNSPSSSLIPPTPEELPSLVPKIGSQILDAFSTQAKKQIQQLSQDLADPLGIPQRVSKQTLEIAQEARNVFLETPEGLVTAPYTVMEQTESYEIREYEGYDAASTTMSKIGEPYSMDDITSSGTAFQTLAAYIFGANEEEQTLNMTTPVITTSDGEMRFYLYKQQSSDELPTPTINSSKDFFQQKGTVSLTKVPPARLAVARFTGFVTDGEVARQKDALLTRLANDGVELDVDHGALVPHVVLQYNPPYTIPIVRRNEIAVPVRKETDIMSDDNESLKKEWQVEEEGEKKN